MVISDCTVGMGITGSFWSFEKTKDAVSYTHLAQIHELCSVEDAALGNLILDELCLTVSKMCIRDRSRTTQHTFAKTHDTRAF